MTLSFPRDGSGVSQQDIKLIFSIGRLSLSKNHLLQMLRICVMSSHIFFQASLSHNTFGCFALTDEESASGVAVGEQLPLCILPAQFTKIPTAGKQNRKTRWRHRFVLCCSDGGV